MKPIILHNLNVPLAKRNRTHTGPYKWTPAKPMSGRGFYMETGTSELTCAAHGSGFSLRVELASDHVGGRLSYTQGYSNDLVMDQYTPIILRLPRGRGFVAGWTLGEGMASSMDPDIHAEIQDAAYAAYQLAERAFDKEVAYQEAWQHGANQKSRLQEAIEMLRRGAEAIRAAADATTKGADAGAKILANQGRKLVDEALEIRTEVWSEMSFCAHPHAAREGFQI